jgi:hypothetical protein
MINLYIQIDFVVFRHLLLQFDHFVICIQWFPHRKGMVSGIILGGFGLGSFTITQFQTLYLNPDNRPIGSLNGTETDDDK